MFKCKELIPVKGREVTPEQLERINRYTRRSLGAEEVYVFSLILCDNEIDRDLERFDDEALETLGRLFLGRTGVFDHPPRAENQSARIFDARVEAEPEAPHSLGMEYRCLKAWAYMVRCDKTADLILEIDAGIKKEVSVGCAVEVLLCSACGADQKKAPCAHKKGERVEGVPCHHILHGPTDAYEWSFVAVPAQKKAGVVKRYHPQNPNAKGQEENMKLQKLFEETGDVTLTAAQVAGLEKEYRELAELARAGGEYLESLRRDVVKLALLSQKGMDPRVMEGVAARMDAGELRAFQKAFAASLEDRFPLPQLAGPGRETEALPAANEAFRI